jgi:hypothetical protein
MTLDISAVGSRASPSFNLNLGATNATTNLVSRGVNIYIGNASALTGDFNVITLNNASFLTDALHPVKPALRVNQIVVNPGGPFFGVNAFSNVTISRAANSGYAPATSFGTVVPGRKSGTWILGATNRANGAYPVPGTPVVATSATVITGFLERARLTLHGKGLKVTLLDSGVTETYVDYMGVGFVVNFNQSASPYGYLEIESDATFVKQNVSNYLTVNVGVTRPRIIINEGVYPVNSQNVLIVSSDTTSSPDYVLRAADPGLSLSIAAPARFYVGVPTTRIYSINPFGTGAIPTLRFVSNQATTTVYVRTLDLGTSTASAKFYSGDNGALSLVVGDIPYATTGNGYSSDGSFSARHAFSFSGVGQTVGQIANLTHDNYTTYVSADVPYHSLTVSGGAVIRVPAGRVFFVNASHLFPDPRYYVVLNGQVPRYTALGSNRHPVICGSGVVCGKFELVFKNDDYYRNNDHTTLGELAEQKCFTLGSAVHVNESVAGLQCVGYDSLELKPRGLSSPNPLSYNLFPLQSGLKTFWGQHLYTGVHAVTISGQGLEAGLAVNVDNAVALSGADLFLLPPTGSEVIYLDSTAFTHGHLKSLTVQCQVQILSVEQTGVQWPATTLAFTVAQTYLNWTNFKYDGLVNVTLPFSDYSKLSREWNKATHITLTNVGTAQNYTTVNFTAWSADFITVDGVVNSIPRTAAGSLTITGWQVPGGLTLLKTAPLVGSYSFAVQGAPLTAPVNVTCQGTWSTVDTQHLTLSANYLNLDVNRSHTFGPSLVLGRELRLAAKLDNEPYSGNITFSGVVTAGSTTNGFTLVDSYMTTQTIFNTLVLRTGQFTHMCWNSPSVPEPVTVGCQPVIVRNLTMVAGVLVNATAGIQTQDVTIQGTGPLTVEASGFNFTHLTIGLQRGSTANPYLWFNDTTDPAALVPTAPKNGAIKADISNLETGDEIVARGQSAYGEFTFDSSVWHRLVCSAKFNCEAWKAAFDGSAGQVRTWPDGSKSTFQLRCSHHNVDAPISGTRLYYVPGNRWENGNFTDWKCLDYKEVITGGSAGSPHADFGTAKGKKLSKGAIAGIVIAVVVALLIIAVVVIICCRKKGGAGRPSSAHLDDKH